MYLIRTVPVEYGQHEEKKPLQIDEKAHFEKLSVGATLLTGVNLPFDKVHTG